jgi:NADP-dependent 3-hydroxy acid dehydrogenase YdfG
MSSLNPTNPYADAHVNPQGSGDARPTAIQIIQDEGLVNGMVGKIMLVTGSTSGIGVETVRALHWTGADIYMQARDSKKAEAVRDGILSSSPGRGKLEIVLMDLNSLASVREGVKDLLTRTGKLNVLINNAGTTCIIHIQTHKIILSNYLY